MTTIRNEKKHLAKSFVQARCRLHWKPTVQIMVVSVWSIFAGKVLKSRCTIRKLRDSQPRGWRQWRLIGFAFRERKPTLSHTYSKGCFSLFFTFMLVQLKWFAEASWTSKKWVYILRLHNFTTFHNGSLAASSSPQVLGESVNFIGLSALKWKAE